MRLIIAFTFSLILFACGNSNQQADHTTTEVSYDCQNCGMPYKDFPKWHSKITNSSDENFHFCSNRCLFSQQLKTPKDIKNIEVQDYYSTKTIDGTNAWFVIKSDINGPMGPELISFETKEAALDFQKDHRGKTPIQFDDVTTETLQEMMK